MWTPGIRRPCHALLKSEAGWLRGLDEDKHELWRVGELPRGHKTHKDPQTYLKLKQLGRQVNKMKGAENVHRATDPCPCPPTDSTSETLASHAYCTKTTYKHFLHIRTTCGPEPCKGRKFLSVGSASTYGLQTEPLTHTDEGDSQPKRRKPLSKENNVTSHKCFIFIPHSTVCPSAETKIYYHANHVMTPRCDVWSEIVYNSPDMEKTFEI